MKASVISAVVAPAVLANAQWWGMAPDCAHDCFSSAWSSSSAWPAPTAYCSATQGPDVSKCISASCSATPTVMSSYSSLSSSLCSQWSSCSSSGSTGTYTLTASGWTGGGGPAGGPWGRASRTWTGGVYTVTGCEWEGSPWAGGPGGMGFGGGFAHGPGGSPWGDWGHGWTWTTRTVTVTTTYSTNGAQTTSTGLATVAEAAQSGVTSTTILRAEATDNAAKSDKSVKVVGAVLGGVVAVAGML